MLLPTSYLFKKSLFKQGEIKNMELDPGDNNRKHFSSTVSLFLNTVLGYTLLRKGKGNFEMESKCGLLKFLLEPYKGSCGNDTASKTN